MSEIDRGRFITFEGIDGTGKSTIARLVAEKLKAGGIDAVETLNPTKTWLGEAVKRSHKEEISPFTEVFLFMADRATHTMRVRDWLAEGKWVLCDRYHDSSVAYQGAALADILTERGIDSMNWIQEIHKPVIETPDRTFLLMLDPEVSLSRITGRDYREKFEYADFLEKVQDVYLRIAKKEPERFVVVDACAGIEEVLGVVMEHLEDFLLE